jgi:cytochrome c oxidase cbb3-type subunit 2
MTFRQFAFGLTASFGLAWLAMVVIPFFKLRNPSPVSFEEGVDAKEGIYHPKRAGRVANGAIVYAANGCYQCHTQVVRPTYAGNDMGRPDFGGLKADPDRGDTRRESNVFDYIGVDFAQIGVTRLGPDLMNVGRRMEAEHGVDAEAWLYKRLYDPRLIPALTDWSACPSFSFLFETRKVTGQRSDAALDVPVEDGFEVVPGEKASALVEYLMSLKHDDEVPSSMNFAPAGSNKEG